MNYLEGTYSDLVKKLYDQNLYSLLSYEEKEEIENLLIGMVSSVSQVYEKKVGKNAYCGVELKFSDEVKFSIKSSLLQNEKYEAVQEKNYLSSISGRWDELKKELMKYSLFPLEDIESL